MRLIRFGPSGEERPGALVDDGTALDLSSEVDDFDPGFLARGGLDTLRQLVDERADLPRVDLDGVRLGPPLAQTPLIVCIGLNYADHARESGQDEPAEPVVFLKSPATIVGPDDPVTIPLNSVKTDWEVELGVVIGATARYLPDPDASADVIAGYVLSNDVSEREYQLERGGQWDKGKSCETFNPLGPWLVTTDEIEDPQQLALWCDVNGQRMQHGTTTNMIFGVQHVVWYLSQFMVLNPGDIINSGTPAGVGLGLDPPRYLKAGDTMTLGGTGLGEQHHVCLDADVHGGHLAETLAVDIRRAT